MGAHEFFDSTGLSACYEDTAKFPSPFAGLRNAESANDLRSEWCALHRQRPGYLA